MIKSIKKQFMSTLNDGKILKQVQDDVKVGFGRTLAFTLAEVLIVIGIIGVVAALTLPNLNHATGDKEKVTKVKKIYSTLTEAVDRAQAIYGNCDTWFNDLADDDYAKRSERFAKRVTEFMKVSKDCGIAAGCFSSAPFLYYDNSVDQSNYSSSLIERNDYMVTLADGMSLAFETAQNPENPDIRIRVDIDGSNKGKNKSGDDIFDFIIPINHPDFLNNNQLSTIYVFDWCRDDGSEACNYGYLTKWVVEFGNMDYLKADENGVCPNGTTLNYYTQQSCN